LVSQTNDRFWPATEIAVADYVAENLPFNFQQIKKSKRNSEGPVMAGSTNPDLSQ